MNNFASTSSRTARPVHFVAAVIVGAAMMACSSNSTTPIDPGTSNTDAGGGGTDDSGAAILSVGAKQCTSFASKTTAVAGASSGVGPSISVDGTVYEATLPAVRMGNHENGTYWFYDGYFHIKVPSAGTLYFFSDGTLPFSSAGIAVNTNGTGGPTGSVFCYATDWIDDAGNVQKASPCNFGCNSVQFAESFQVTPGTYDVDVNSGNTEGIRNPAVTSASMKMSFTFVPAN